MKKYNTKEIFSELETESGLNMVFFYHTEVVLKTLNSIFAKILGKIDMIYLLDTVITILREIISNAVKANTKRVFFKKLNIDIRNHEDYKKGIEDFKLEIVGEYSKIQEELKGNGFKVHICLKKSDNDIQVQVSNNAAILPEELARIKLRIEKAKEFNDFTDAYDEVYDDTEGAGLGIVLTILLLRNSGIDESSFNIETDGKTTNTLFRIPFQLKSSSLTTQVKERIINEVNILPTFEEHIIALQKLCKDPNVAIEDVATKIMQDPALSADILKLSNSAGFITGKRIESIEEAVMVVGLVNIYDIIIATGARSILENRYPKFEQIWAHCNKTALYAKNLAINFGLNKIKEQAYLGGLLHDIGKIILLATDRELTNWISDIVKNRKIRTSTIMEEVSIGVSHSSIGELMSEKWNFPDYLHETIRFHHSPLCADEKFSDFIFIVYLANMFCGIETRKYNYYYFEDRILERFNINSESQLEQLHTKLKNMHNNE
ncbi:MAG: HDOD domain-containing protein [Spirochaetota bacterium]|nr:HDOD domain-containing protein [Spirochaetota bacterium]